MLLRLIALIALISLSGCGALYKLDVQQGNLFDKDPPIFIPTSNQFQAGYDVTMYDPRARTVYLSAAYKF